MSAGEEGRHSGIVDRSKAAADLSLADIEIGQTFSIEHSFGEREVDAFAALCGDFSPLHVDGDYGATTDFGGRVVHGMLLASLFSTLVGMRIPGRKAMYLGQEINFRRPVMLDERIVATATVTAKNAALGVIQLAMSITKEDGTSAVSGSGRVKIREKGSATDHPSTAGDRPAESDRQIRRRVALVTGASRGVGAAIARRLARDGFQVVVNFLTNGEAAAQVVADIEAGGGTARSIRADVRDEAAVAGMIDEVQSSLGGLDLLVNNAAHRLEEKPAVETDWSDIGAHVDMSVRVPFLLSRAAYNMLRNSRGGIVNIITRAVENVPPQQMLDYVVGKYGLLGLTRALAVEWAADGIRVNGVAPSLMETDMTSHLKERIFKLEASRTPLQRLAGKDDVAAAVSYLGGKDAEFLTGVVLPVSGGQVMK